jgi:hypothetical protein
MKEKTYISTTPMERTDCTEPQCLFKGALYYVTDRRTDGRQQPPHQTPPSSLPTEWLQVSSYFPTNCLRICKTSRPSPVFAPDATLIPRLCTPGTTRGSNAEATGAYITA